MVAAAEGRLSPGQALSTPSGHRCTVTTLLGGGSQGEVYEADLEGAAVALKWYFPAWATAGQRRVLEQLVGRRPPSPAFLWPVDLVTAPGLEGYGYLMPLREARYRSMTDVMRRAVEPRFIALATAGQHLAHNLLRLHTQGLCYRDISFGNVALDPDTGDVMIADNDNVAVDGVGAIGLLGTPRFMAPEIVRGEAVPGIRTDLYSLAVLLFYLFVLHHPLEGRRERAVSALDLPAMTRLYGVEPVFIFDPDDDSNRPVPGEHDNAAAFWPLYPAFLQQLFIRSFTDGLRDPVNGRVREAEWRQAMAALRDLVISCPTCKAESFAEPTGAPVQPTCWSCHRDAVAPLHLNLGAATVMLGREARLFPHHVDPRRRFDYAQAVAEVSVNPADPSALGLRNLSESPWRASTPAGSVYAIQPRQSIRLTPGVAIDFGATQGRVAPDPRLQGGDSMSTPSTVGRDR